jgi:hypothetical protein
MQSQAAKCPSITGRPFPVNPRQQTWHASGRLVSLKEASHGHRCRVTAFGGYKCAPCKLYAVLERGPEIMLTLVDDVLEFDQIP